MLVEDYYERVQELLKSIRVTQMGNIEVAAEKVANSIMHGGIVHTFGPGHSDMIAREVTGRAGGLVPINRIPDPTEGMAERVEGYAKVILKNYEQKYKLESDECLIIISNSGRNPLPIEIAIEAKARNLFTIAITSLKHSKKVSSRHKSGKRLFEIADFVLDTRVSYGDSLVEIPGLPQKAGPGSTIAGALLINMLMIKVIDKIVKEGKTPPILKSQNVDGADEFNKGLKGKYGDRLAW